MWDLRMASRPLDQLTGHKGLVTAMDIIPPASGARAREGGGHLCHSISLIISLYDTLPV